MKQALQRLLTSETLANPRAWRTLRQEDADALRKELQSRMAFWHWPVGIARQTLCLLGLFLVGYLLAIAAHLGSASSPEELNQLGRQLRHAALLSVLLLPVAFILMAIASAALKDMLAHRMHWLLMYLQPLDSIANQGDCSKALLLVELSQGCARYRDAVLANGRQLLAGDLQIMEEINRAEVQERQISDSELACRMLHRLHPA